MDFLDPAKKRSHNRRLFLGYLLVGITILMASIILIFLTYGYDLDRKTGEVIQNGLIFTDTAPESANIYLNGKDNGQTDKRLTVPAGKYDVEFKRDGYRSWKKTLQLEGSSIERLVYAKLFPEKLVQATSTTYTGTPTFSSQSLDRRWLLVAQPGSITSWQVFDTGAPTKEPTVLTVPANVMTPPATGSQSLTLVEWSTDNRHVLVRHDYDSAYEFIMLDREDGAATVNINKLLATNPTTISLRDKKFNQLYLYDAATKVLSTADTKTKQVAPLIDNVVSYKSYGANLVLYAGVDPAKPGKTIVKVWDETKAYTLQTYNETKVLLDVAQFDGAWYVVAVPVAEGRAYIYKDPFDKIKSKAASASVFAVMKMTDPAFVSFSANTRFVSVQSGKRFAVYDFEMNRRFGYEIPGEVATTQKISWMDGHRFMSDQAGKVVVFDFDGTNRQELSSTIPGVLPYFTRDYLRLYTLAPVEKDPTKITLTRSSLKVNLKP